MHVTQPVDLIDIIPRLLWTQFTWPFLCVSNGHTLPDSAQSSSIQAVFMVSVVKPFQFISPIWPEICQSVLRSCQPPVFKHQDCVLNAPFSERHSCLLNLTF